MPASEPEGRRERKKREVRRRIRRAAAKLFAEKGYEATTVDEITEVADVAKGTFFNYFPRKDVLLVELGNELMEDLEEELGPRERWVGSFRSQILRFFLSLGERVHRDPNLSKVMIVESVRNLWMRGEEEHEAVLRGVTRALLERGVESGEFPHDIEVEVGVKLLEAAYVTATVESLRLGTSVGAYRTELITRFNIIFRGLGGESVRMEESGE